MLLLFQHSQELYNERGNKNHNRLDGKLYYDYCMQKNMYNILKFRTTSDEENKQKETQKKREFTLLFSSEFKFTINPSSFFRTAHTKNKAK